MSKPDLRASADNPLLTGEALPRLDAVRAEHVGPAVDVVLAEQRQTLARLETTAPSIEWLQQLELVHEAVHRVWSPISHMNSVVSTPALRDAFNGALPKITEFSTDLGQNEPLHERFVQLGRSVTGGATAPATRLIELALRDFRLAGVALAPPARQRFREIMQALARHQASFEQNVMDATDAFRRHVTDRTELAGLPAGAVRRARDAAEADGLEGWRLSLDAPTYMAVMTHAESEALRTRFYEAWVTRASDQGPDAGRWNNGPLIENILALRHEAAKLLDFEHYAGLSLATKMAGSAEEVIEFLDDLAARSRSRARDELGELTEFAGRELEPWDLAFYAERMKQQRLQLAGEELRAYFPVERVLRGLFELVETLFELRIRPVEAGGLWHADARRYEFRQRDGPMIGTLFTDLFARPNKRGGAWMDTCLNRVRLGRHEQQPMAHLVCNFSPPSGSEPSLLSHGDVVTLFHEFGHALHHLLTEVDYPSVAGINGVAWDAVELPSQFLENFAWLPDVLTRVSGHHQSGEPLPKQKIDKVKAARTWLSGLAMVRQLEFALFDFRLHSRATPATEAEALAILADVRREVAVIEPPAYNRFPSSFTHIFGGGYAAGYYSYKWAEVLAADAFDAFAETGAFDRATAARFRRSILAVGGSRDALEAFVDFRGRPPQLDALLRQAGIA